MIVRKYNDLVGPLFHYDGTVRLWFSPSKWLYLRETPDGLQPIGGVTNTLKIVDKSNALIPWAIRKDVEKFLLLMSECIRPDMFYEVEVQDLLGKLDVARKEHTLILEEAGETGHDAHGWVESFAKATLKDDEMRRLEILSKFPEDERAANCVVAALAFFAEHNIRFITTEQRVYSRRLDVAGTMDGDVLIDSCGNPACSCNVGESFKDARMVLDLKTSNGIWSTYLAQAALYRAAKVEEFFPEDPYKGQLILRLGKDNRQEFEPFFAIGDKLYQAHLKFFEDALALKADVSDAESLLREIRDRGREIERKRREEEKAAQMKIRCPKADEYKGQRATKCLPDGSQCEACASIRAAYLATKSLTK